MTLDDILWLIFCVGGIYIFFKGWKNFSWQHFKYSLQHPTFLRMEELRKQYDGVDELEAVVKIVESNPDLEVYAYVQYSNLAGGETKECKIPIKPNSRMWTMLCEEEKKRLYKEIGRSKQIFRLPFRD